MSVCMFFLSVYWSMYLFIYPSISVYLLNYSSFNLNIVLFEYPSIYLSVFSYLCVFFLFILVGHTCKKTRTRVRRSGVLLCWLRNDNNEIVTKITEAILWKIWFRIKYFTAVIVVRGICSLPPFFCVQLLPVTAAFCRKNGGKKWRIKPVTTIYRIAVETLPGIQDSKTVLKYKIYIYIKSFNYFADFQRILIKF